MDIAVPYIAALVVILCVSRWTDWKQQRRRAKPISRRVRRLARKHKGESGLVVQVFWPVALRGWSLSVDAIDCSEPARWRKRHAHFLASAIGRRRPFWVALKPGRHDLTLRAIGKRPQEKDVRVNLDRGEHVLMLCWPAKRGFVTRERLWTDWTISTLPPGN